MSHLDSDSAAPATPMVDRRMFDPVSCDGYWPLVVEAAFARRLETLCRQQQEALRKARRNVGWPSTHPMTIEIDGLIAAYDTLKKEI